MQTIRVRTTQNVFIDYPLASIGDRIVAYLIDRLILFLYILLVISLMVGMKAFENETLLITLGLIFVVFPMLFYGLFFEIFMNGQTPGKHAMKIQVIRLDGTPASVGGYLFRWLFSIVDFGIFGGVVAVVIIAVGGKGQRLGDIVAGTTVVKLAQQKEINSSDVFIVPEATYVPTFEQVVQLSTRDIEVIQRALDANRDHGTYQPMEIITEKIKSMLGIHSDLPPSEFLYTIVKDYNSLTAGR
jgi:uncharacterized RDD family membrane protein YckC